MPKMTVRVLNMGSLQGKVKRLNWGIQAAVVMALRNLAGPIEEDVKNVLSKPKSGPTVTRYNPERQVKVSKPYEAPAKDTGFLVASVEADVDPQQFNLTLSAAAKYAKPLENGTRHMLPRPFLRPALTRWRQRIIDAIHKAIKEACRV